LYRKAPCAGIVWRRECKRTGTIQKVLDGLAGRTVFEFGGIEPNPQFNTLMKAVELVRQNNIDFLLAVGAVR
jgi:NADP-dependent alcohol dehydrogenase